MKLSIRHSLPVLVVEDNPDHQLLIGYCFRAAVPRVEPIFSTSAQETLTYLETCAAGLLQFPKLVLLDIHLPDSELGWQLLSELKRRHQLLPVIVFSAYPDPDYVNKAYTLGAHSFMVKPRTLSDWETHFQTLRAYWFETVTLPPIY